MSDELSWLPAKFQAVWRQYKPFFLPFGFCLTVIPLVFKYWYETQRILGLVPGSGGIDLGFYYRWTHQWFNGVDIYLANSTPQGYPPASIVLLYPLTGWLTMEQARVVWALTTLIAFVAVLGIAIRAMNANHWQARVSLGLLLLLINGTGVTYGNGQASLLVLALVLAAVLILHTRPTAWRTDLVGALLFLGALVKPNLSAPYLWLLVFFPCAARARPLTFVAVGYLALSLFAAQFVHTPLSELLSQFLAARVPEVDISLDPNVHYLLGRLGLDQTILVVSAIIWIGLGIWVYRHRRVNVWQLLAVTTLVMRFWGFHWIYDNVFMIIPEIALIQIFKTDPAHQKNAALLLGLNILVTLPPGNFGGQSETIQVALILGQALVWGATLLFILMYAREPSRFVSEAVVQVSG